MYQKEIIYMSLFDHDMKEGCVGYCKLERRQGDSKLELQVKNIPGTIVGSFPIRLQGESDWQEVDSLTIQNGNGRWSGKTTEQVFNVEILLPGFYKIKGQSRNAISNGAERKIAPVSSIEQVAELQQSNRPQEPTFVPQQPVKPQEQILVPQQSDKSQEQVSVPQQTGKSQEQPFVPQQPVKPLEQVSISQKSVDPWKQVFVAQEPTEPQERSSNPQKYTYNKLQKQIGRPQNATLLYENKWEQILATYEKIYPYGDDRVYVKLEPKDFVILRSNYQHLVNNSFLLHGFYNYRYVILGKEQDFYLGVPGVYYERERMVALMFGFEAFECEGGVAQEGKFGYYLKKVEL